MEIEEIKDRVDKIISMKGDDEVAHIEEDRLHLYVIRKFCPKDVVDEIERLNGCDFQRWCA